jgi:hypothetical protein
VPTGPPAAEACLPRVVLLTIGLWRCYLEGGSVRSPFVDDWEACHVVSPWVTRARQDRSAQRLWASTGDHRVRLSVC